MFIRENRFGCGDYSEIDIIPRTDTADRAVRGRRAKKRIQSRPAQDNINNKNSARYLTRLANGNFKNYDDYWLTLTYKKKFHPKNLESAEKEVRKYLDRLNYRCRKMKSELKYILVTEFEFDEEGEQIKSFHHHLIINGVLDRDEVEACWSKGRGKKKESLGRANTRRLQFDNNGIVGITEYITKSKFSKRGRKKWSSSRNLKRPYMYEPNDYKFTPSEIEKMALSNDGGMSKLQRIYKNYYIAEIVVKHYRLTGYHIYLKMWRKKGKGIPIDEFIFEE
jgi:hypothetical protein